MDKKVKAWLIVLTVIVAILLVAIIVMGSGEPLFSPIQKGIVSSSGDTKETTQDFNPENIYLGVLGMLNRCEILELQGLSGTCSQACRDNFNPDKICIIGGFLQIDEGQFEWRLHHQFECNQIKSFGNHTNVFCTCCSR